MKIVCATISSIAPKGALQKYKKGWLCDKSRSKDMKCGQPFLLSKNLSHYTPIHPKQQTH
jgi:hypothetical protein